MNVNFSHPQWTLYIVAKLLALNKPEFYYIAHFVAYQDNQGYDMHISLQGKYYKYEHCCDITVIL